MLFVHAGRRGTRSAVLYCECLESASDSSSAESRKGFAAEVEPTPGAEMMRTFCFSKVCVGVLEIKESRTGVDE